MSRIMTIWIPKWPVQRRLVEQPERRKMPLLVCRREPRGVMTVVSMALGERVWKAGRGSSQAGAAAGSSIAPGLSLAETLAAISIAHGSRACRMAEIDADDPAADRAVLEGIARWCRRFSPIVAIESAARPERIHVDVTGTSRLFGGEESVVRTAVWTLASRGLHVRAAVADTAAAASVASGMPASVSAASVSAASVAAASVAAASVAAASVAASGGGSLLPAAEVGHQRNVPGCRTTGRRIAGSRVTGSRVTGSRVTGSRVTARRWFCVVPPGEQKTLLAELPVSALGKEKVGEKAIASLAELGITTIGQLLRLPRKSLASRFGERLERRIAEFLGALEEPLDALRDDSFPAAECRLAAPAATLDAIRSVIDGLVGRCVAPLVARSHGVTAMQVRLEAASFQAESLQSESFSTDSGCMDSSSTDSSSMDSGSATHHRPPTVIDIGLFQPSTSVKHLVELVELRLSRMHLPGEVESVAVEVIAAGPVTCRQKTLFGGEAGVAGGAEADASNVEMLLDRLVSRLGRRAVFEPKPVADAQPEHAWTATPPAASPSVRSLDPGSKSGTSSRKGASGSWKSASGSGSPAAIAGNAAVGGRRARGVVKADSRTGFDSVAGSSAVASRSRLAPIRPIWLAPRPMRLEAVSVVPDGPPVRFRLGPDSHRVVEAHGPERIETAWWRGECVRRDYYIVETESGSRWWLFRRLRDGCWFLHGQFA